MGSGGGGEGGGAEEAEGRGGGGGRLASPPEVRSTTSSSPPNTAWAIAHGVRAAARSCLGKNLRRHNGHLALHPQTPTISRAHPRWKT